MNQSNLVDIDNYCEELASITDLDLAYVRGVVLMNFCKTALGQITFLEATEQIEDTLTQQMVKKDQQNLTLSAV